MASKFLIKVKNSSIRLPDEFLDHFLINEGDFIALIEENGKFYLRKTREVPKDDSVTEDQEPDVQKDNPSFPPRTFDEIMREAQKQFGTGVPFPDDIMKSLQDALKDPDMMKKIQDMAMGLFKGFSPPPSNDSESNSSSTKTPTDPKKKTKKSSTDDDDDDDSGSGFKINIE